MPKREILGNMFSIPDNIDLNFENRVKKTEADLMNELKGNLGGYDCDECKNKGVVYYYTDSGELVYRACSCMSKRKTFHRIQRSGLGNVLDRFTFDNFNADNDYQLFIKTQARKFLKSDIPFFFIGGQSGAGKTHICTALMGEFIKKGKSGVYMQWRQHSIELKQNINDPSYKELIDQYKFTDVLYIDDLFKTEKGAKPTTADINIAFEIINARYLNSMKTIISSEFFLSEIIDFDEAVGGRIKEMCTGFKLDVKRDRNRNYRLT